MRRAGFGSPTPTTAGGLGRWSVSVEAAGFAPAWRIVVPTGQIPPLDFRLSPGKPFRGRVVDSKGKPIGQARSHAPDGRNAITSTGKPRPMPTAGSSGRTAQGKERSSSIFGKSGYGAALSRYVTAAAGPTDFTINPQLRARGKVVDAETKQPIRSFTAIPGTAFQDSEIDFRRTPAAKGGEAVMKSWSAGRDQPRSLFYVRIEAKGYVPTNSRPMNPSEGEVTLDFALKKANGISGVIRLPDGTAAAGADVYIDGLGYTHGRLNPPPLPGISPTGFARPAPTAVLLPASGLRPSASWSFITMALAIAPRRN